MTKPSAHDPLLRAADAVGGLMEFWGFKRNMGRLWCVLYLEDQPLSAPELCERLSLSAGAVSMTLSELSKWGAVRKAWVPGERRDHYEAESNIWKMVSRVFRERELAQIQTSIEAFEAAEQDLERRRRERGGGKDTADIDFLQSRIDSLLELARIGERLLDAVLAGESVDASPLALFDRGDEP